MDDYYIQSGIANINDKMSLDFRNRKIINKKRASIAEERRSSIMGKRSSLITSSMMSSKELI